MQFTLTTILLSAAALTTASPLTRRACQIAYPQSIGFPINYDVHQDANGANARTDALSFSPIPAGSYGCQLEINFPANYPITSSGSSAINIFATSGAQETLFGTVTLQSSPVAPTKYVVNSAQCAQVMSYRLEIADKTKAGRVAFADTKDAGFTMTYNC
jgi:hypothetical protein